MLIPVYVGKKLNKEVIENIKNKKYSEQELKEIYDTILTNTENSKTGLISNAVIFFVVFGFIAYQMIAIDKRYLLLGVLFGLGCYAITMLILYSSFTAAKRQFTKLVKENYPDVCERIVK